jgi:hypothetical protein
MSERCENCWALEINQEESDECSAELFALVCAVLDNRPEAAKARQELERHIEHVRACRKGSCDTELHGGRLRRELAAEKARADAAERTLAATASREELWHNEAIKLRDSLAAVTKERDEARQDAIDEREQGDKARQAHDDHCEYRDCEILFRGAP